MNRMASHVSMYNLGSPWIRRAPIEPSPHKKKKTQKTTTATATATTTTIIIVVVVAVVIVIVIIIATITIIHHHSNDINNHGHNHNHNNLKGAAPPQISRVVIGFTTAKLAVVPQGFNDTGTAFYKSKRGPRACQDDDGLRPCLLDFKALVRSGPTFSFMVLKVDGLLGVYCSTSVHPEVASKSQ